MGVLIDILQRIEEGPIRAEQLHALAHELDAAARVGVELEESARYSLAALETRLVATFSNSAFPSLGIYPLPPEAYGAFLDGVVRICGALWVIPYLSDSVPLEPGSIVAILRKLPEYRRDVAAYLAGRLELLSPELLAALPSDFFRRIFQTFEFPGLRAACIEIMVRSPDAYTEMLSVTIEPETLRRLLDSARNPEMMIARRPEVFLPFLWGEPDRNVSVWLRSASLETMTSLCDAAKRLLMAMRSGIGRDMTHLVQERELQFERWLDAWHQSQVQVGIRTHDMHTAIVATTILKSLPLTRKQLAQGDAAHFQALSGQVSGAPAHAMEILKAWRICDDLVRPIENTALRYLRRWLGNDPDPDVALSLQQQEYPMWWADTPYGKHAALLHLDQLLRSAPEDAIRLLPLICSYHRPDAEFDRALALQVHKIPPELLMDHSRSSAGPAPAVGFPLVLSALSMVGVASATKTLAESAPGQLQVAPEDRNVFVSNLLLSKWVKSSPAISHVLPDLLDVPTMKSSLLFLLEHWKECSDPRSIGGLLACCLGERDVQEIARLLLVLRVAQLKQQADVELLLSQIPRDSLSFLTNEQWVQLLSLPRSGEATRDVFRTMAGGATCLEAASLIEDAHEAGDPDGPVLVHVLLSAYVAELSVPLTEPPQCSVCFEVA